LLGGGAFRVLSAAEPALQVGSVHVAEHQDHAVAVDEVVHHAVVADTQSVEAVLGRQSRASQVIDDPQAVRRKGSSTRMPS
jgi:hypothetical protein